MVHVIEATDDQIARMKRLGVIATVTPNFMYMASDRFNLQEIGERAIPIRRLLDAGVPVSLSSDNVPYSMLWTMWEALARWDADSGRALGESRLGREEALRLVTRTGPLISIRGASQGNAGAQASSPTWSCWTPTRSPASRTS